MSNDPQPTPHCAKCFEEFGEKVRAHFHCTECNLHFCEADSLRHRKLFQHQICKPSSVPSEVVVAESSTPSASDSCPLHHLPINAYCKTCERLMCSSCGLSAEHRSHSCFLLQDLDEEERTHLRSEWISLNEKMNRWEESINLNKKPFEEWMVHVESERLRLRSKVSNHFNKLRDLLQHRQDDLNQKIDEKCRERADLVQAVLDLKNYRNEFEKLLVRTDHWTTLKLVQTKQTIHHQLTQLRKLAEDVSFRFVFKNCEDMMAVRVVDMDVPFQSIRNKMDKLGEVESVSLPSKVTLSMRRKSIRNKEDIIPITKLENYQYFSLEEVDYDRNMVSTYDAPNGIGIIKTAGSYNYTSIFAQTPIHSGQLRWRILIKNLLDWIGVGVVMTDRVEGREFSDFVYPYDSHGMWLVGMNNSCWTPGRTSKYVPFQFAVDDVLEVEVNQESRQMVVTNLLTKKSVVVKDVKMPVCPVVVLGSKEDEVVLLNV